MKTTTMRTVGAIFSAGILLTSCVSSKKYHASQAAVAKLQSDSSTLAQQVSTLNQNVSSMQQKNGDLQKTVESANTTNSGLQKNVAYYTDYAGKQHASTTAISDELKTALAASGITEQDIMLADGKIYVNIGEKNLFKGNSAVLTTKGKDLVNNFGQFVKSHEAVDVSVADLQLSNAGSDAATTTATGDASSSSADNAQNSSTTSNGKITRSSSVSGDNTATNNNADYSNTATKKAKHSVAVHHTKKPIAASGESKSVAYSSKKHNKYTAERSNRSTARAIAWKRQTVIGDALLKNGIPKVKLVDQLPNGSTKSTAPKGVQVVLVNDMDNFYKHMSEAPASAQPVSKNP